MTTPQGMLELADNLMLMKRNAHGRIVLALETKDRDLIVDALRQAAAPQGQEVREKEITRLATIEECARIADSFTCGSCGVDGKAGAAIRALAQAQEPGEDKQ